MMRHDAALVLVVWGTDGPLAVLHMRSGVEGVVEHPPPPVCPLRE